MTKEKELKLYAVNLRLFDGNLNINTTLDVGLSGEMKTYYSDYLIDMAEPYLVHDQFGQKKPIPPNNGKEVEFRKYDSLPKALTPLTEGVTPDGLKLNMTTLTAHVEQYGSYVGVTDILQLTAIDNNINQATKLCGSQAGRTLDTITREVLNGGTNVLYCGGKTDRTQLTGGSANPDENDYLTVDDVRRAVRTLKIMNTEKINGDYVAIIHPDVAYDLMNDPKWINVKTYSDPEGIYEGEIGKLEGVRFVETTEAKRFSAENLTEAAKTLTVAAYASKVITVDEAISAAEAEKLTGRLIIVKDELCEIVAAVSGAAGAATITLKETPSVTPADGDIVYPGEAGAGGRVVYSTLFLGDNAYGVTELTGGGLRHIVKQLGSAGTADPLDQRATVGWKATKTAERLVEQYMVRVESASTFEIEDE